MNPNNPEKNNNEITYIKKKDAFFSLLITEITYVLIVLSAALIIKFFFPEAYSDIKNWYDENILSETSISQITEVNNNGNEI